MLQVLAGPGCPCHWQQSGISFHILVDQDTRRRLKSTVHIRDDMLVNTFQDWFSKRLAAFNLLARVGGGPLALVQLVLYGESTTVELEVTCKCCSLKLLQQ